jgi:hypothetical protein
VKLFVGEKIKNVHELQKHNIYIFSYFFDAARDAGLIGMYLSIVYIDLPCIDCKFFLVGTKNSNFVEDHPRNIPAKFGSNRPSGFGEEA